MSDVGVNLGGSEDDVTDETCPICGDDLEVFEVYPQSEELAARMMRSVLACDALTDEELALIEDEKAHIHLHMNDECAD